MGAKIAISEELDLNEVVCQRVNYLMFLNRPLSQRELAMMLGMSASKFNQKMKRVSRWSLEEISAIADTFEVSADWLMGRVALEADAPIAQRQSYGLLIRRS